MTPEALLRRLRGLGVELRVLDGRVLYRPADALADEVRAELRRLTPDVAALLAQDQPHITAGRGTTAPSGWTPSPRREGFCPCDIERGAPGMCLCPTCGQVVASLETR